MTLRDRKWLWLALLGAVLVLGLVYGSTIWSNYQGGALKGMSQAQLEDFLRRHPNDLDARYQLGLHHARNNCSSDATREFLTVLQYDPTRADVLNDLGVSYMLQQRYYEALIALQGALVAQPNFSAAMANLGRLHLATKMPYTAVRELEQAAKLEPNNADLLCDLGEAYQRTLNLRAALATFERVAKEHPKNARSLIGAGRAYYSLADYQRAEPLLRRAMEIDPDNSMPLTLLARVRLERGVTAAERKEVKQLLEKAVAIDPQDADAWYDLGRVAMGSREPKTAIRHFSQALSLSPEHPGATYQISRALRAVGRAADAERLERSLRDLSIRSREISRLEEALHTNPRDWKACGELTALYLRGGNTGMASLYLRQLENGAPNDPQLPKLRAAFAAQTRNSAGGAGAPLHSPSSAMPTARPPQGGVLPRQLGAP